MKANNMPTENDWSSTSVAPNQITAMSCAPNNTAFKAENSMRSFWTRMPALKLSTAKFWYSRLRWDSRLKSLTLCMPRTVSRKLVCCLAPHTIWSSEASRSGRYRVPRSTPYSAVAPHTIDASFQL